MTFRVKKRGDVWRLEGRAGQRAKRGAGERDRIRLSLGTANSDAARLLHSRIERALAEGPESSLWDELRGILPTEAFERLSAIVGHVPGARADEPKHSWQDLVSKFSAWMSHRVALDKLRESTRERKSAVQSWRTSKPGG
jgi:hypothetical protein